jgi:hypothetical protein
VRIHFGSLFGSVAPLHAPVVVVNMRHVAAHKTEFHTVRWIRRMPRWWFRFPIGDPEKASHQFVQDDRW